MTQVPKIVYLLSLPPIASPRNLHKNKVEQGGIWQIPQKDLGQNSPTHGPAIELNVIGEAWALLQKSPDHGTV